MTTITIPRALLKQAMNALLLPCDRWNKQQFKIVTAAAEAIRAELAKPEEQAEPVAWLYSVPGHRSSASCERIPLDMTPRGTAEAPLYLHPPTPAWHDAPTCAGLWVSDYGKFEVEHVNQADVNSFDVAYNAGGRWYGPIQPDVEKS